MLPLGTVFPIRSSADPVTHARESRLGLHLALLCAAAAGWAGSANALRLAVQPIAEVNLVKAQHEGLRFQWQAVVSERGGVFVLRRRGVLGGDIMRPSSPARRMYEAWWHGPAAAGIYELRYRTASGTESLLGTLVVNCQSLDGGARAQDTPQWDAPVATVQARLGSPWPSSRRAAEPAPRASSVPREPLLPPPREVSRG